MPGPDIYNGWSSPTFVSESHFTGTSTNNGFDISSPSGIAVGDYLLMLYVVNKPTITPDAAFTERQNQQGSTNAWSTYIYDRVADATDVAGTTYTWTTVGSLAPTTAVILAYRGVDASKTVIADSLSTTADPVTTPSVTTTRPSLIVQACGTRYSSATGIPTATGPGNEREDGGNGSAVKYTHHVYDSGSVSYTIGSNAGGSINLSTTTTITDRNSYTIALGAVPLNPQVFQRAATFRSYNPW